ncbi:M28 family metallopeptidase [Brevundimonas lutea]|uniref:M28 family metallopeptidase n=1 Tax=Brevundimonas lutea TaxID=2293980 RepID=UPI000F02B7A1|nr:M20/M25/M40 family metallo-hydrolase [Brevundimonas lutea]
MRRLILSAGSALALSLALGSAALAQAAAQQPAAAQAESAADARPDLVARVQAYAQPTNAARLEVLTRQLTEAGLPHQVETFAGGNDQTGPMEGSNVVVTLGEGDRDLLLVAHYDAAVLRDGSLSQGLVDNAASVVSLIEAARALQGQDLDHRVVVLFVDQEELGLIGAEKWIETHGIERVAAVVNTDVGAWGDTIMYGLNNGAQSGFVVRALREQCVEAAIQCIAYPEYPPSDDRAFSAAGAPVVSIGWQDQVGAHEMWLAFNDPDAQIGPDNLPTVFQRIHSAEDRIDWVEGDTLARAGVFHADLIQRLDDALSD